MKRRIVSAFLALTLMLSVFVIPSLAADTTLKLNGTKGLLGVGETMQVVATTNSNKTVKWTTSDSTVAVVSANGLVMGLKVGKAKITAKVDGVETSCTIWVKKAPDMITSITGYLILKQGETFKIGYSVSEGTHSRTATYATNNRKVATVSSTGVVTAIGAGTCKIQVKTYNGKSAIVDVTVFEPIKAPEGAINITLMNAIEGDTDAPAYLLKKDDHYEVAVLESDYHNQIMYGVENDGWVYFMMREVRGHEMWRIKPTEGAVSERLAKWELNSAGTEYSRTGYLRLGGDKTFTIKDGYIYYYGGYGEPGSRRIKLDGTGDEEVK